MLHHLPCTNASCEHITTCRSWPATRVNPPEYEDDGCEGCGAALDWDNEIDPEDMRDPDAEADARAEAHYDQGPRDTEDWR